MKNLIIIPIYINGKGPYNFLLDTGVGPMIITEPSLIDTLGLKNLRSTKIYGLGKGEEIDAYLTQELNASVKEAHIDHIPTAILKQDVFNLSSYVGKKVYGILGFYFFDSFVVKISYTGNRLIFSSPNAKIRKKGHKIPLIIENKRPYIMVDMVTPQQKQIEAKLIVDCGASHALTMEALDGKAFPLPSSAIIANLGVGLSGPISGHVGRIPSITIGKFNFVNVTSGFPAFEAVAAQIGYNTRNGNIGAEFLRRFDTIYDYQNSSMYLKPNSSYRQKFDHDMSGIEVYIDPFDNKRYFIARVEPESPADKLGIKEQDEIISLDFKPIENYSLEQITNLF
ncbi:MAG: peptide-binding protein, partial [Pedobacter sp.]